MCFIISSFRLKFRFQLKKIFFYTVISKKNFQGMRSSLAIADFSKNMALTKKGAPASILNEKLIIRIPNGTHQIPDQIRNNL